MTFSYSRFYSNTGYWFRFSMFNKQMTSSNLSGLNTTNQHWFSSYSGISLQHWWGQEPSWHWAYSSVTRALTIVARPGKQDIACNLSLKNAFTCVQNEALWKQQGFNLRLVSTWKQHETTLLGLQQFIPLRSTEFQFSYPMLSPIINGVFNSPPKLLSRYYSSPPCLSFPTADVWIVFYWLNSLLKISCS